MGTWVMQSIKGLIQIIIALPHSSWPGDKLGSTGLEPHLLPTGINHRSCTEKRLLHLVPVESRILLSLMPQP